uniref:DUF3395 domain-containing protein n=1 Tax=Heterorhabditis bacteriophora TaxID=37862 RepID=A0A1I7XNG7_HETBA
MELKRLEIARIAKESKSAAKYSAAIVASFMVYRACAFLYTYQKHYFQLAEVRKNLCLLLFSIFPIREVIAQTVQRNNTENSPDANKRWTVVNDHIEEGIVFQVRDMCISDASREKLGVALQASVLNLSSDLRSPFAALLHTVQLVNLLTVIFDYRLPYSNTPSLMTNSHKMEIRDASSKLNWEERDLIADWDTCEDVEF